MYSASHSSRRRRLAIPRTSLHLRLLLPFEFFNHQLYRKRLCKLFAEMIAYVLGETPSEGMFATMDMETHTARPRLFSANTSESQRELGEKSLWWLGLLISSGEWVLLLAASLRLTHRPTTMQL